MLKNKASTLFLVGLMVLVGLGSGIAIMANAQSATTSAATPTNTTVNTQAIDTPEPGDVADNADGTDVSTTSTVVKKGEQGDKVGDKDGDPASEASEGAGSSDVGE